MKIGIVLACHPPYHSFLPETLASIDSQGFDQKVLVYDLGEEESLPLIPLPPDWRFVVGKWKNPNLARNAGATELSVDWICFWDADNIMPLGYQIEGRTSAEISGSDCAVIYPDVQEVDQKGNLLHHHKMPQWSLLEAQRRNLCDTASFWRVTAFYDVGGFSAEQPRLDDFDLALRIFRLGWIGRRMQITLNHLRHEDSRSFKSDAVGGLWRAWSFGFVTLWSGHDRQGKILDWLAAAEIPPQSHLYWIDNSAGSAQSSMLMGDYQSRLRNRFPSISYHSVGDPYTPAPGESYLNIDRHSHVARLYNQVLPRVREEIVVFLEDDVVPPPDGLRKLLTHMTPGSRTALVAGVYQSRRTPTHICASRDMQLWTDVPRWSEMNGETPFEVGMTGGGFAIAGNWALRGALPVRCNHNEYGHLFGWDGNLGRDLTGMGYQLLCHPGVRCEHICPEVLDFNASGANS